MADCEDERRERAASPTLRVTVEQTWTSDEMVSNFEGGLAGGVRHGRFLNDTGTVTRVESVGAPRQTSVTLCVQCKL